MVIIEYLPLPGRDSRFIHAEAENPDVVGYKSLVVTEARLKNSLLPRSKSPALKYLPDPYRTVLLSVKL
jgi:hypothetical protein